MGRTITEEEFKESMKNAVPEAPKKKPGPKKKKATQRKAPVAADQKAAALSAASELTKAFADFLTQRADLFKETAKKYIEYTDILEGMK